MSEEQPNNPLHGLTLKAILEALVERHGWEGLARRVNIACFHNEPSLKSSLKLLRKTPWAREKVERIYLADVRKAASRRKRNKRRSEMRAHKATMTSSGASAEKPEAAPTPPTPKATAPKATAPKATAPKATAPKATAPKGDLA
ncbi:MAG: VF530 family DNA-binding protein [Myxococcota bacterium]